MSQRTRMRWFAVWLALSVALSLPLSGAADEELAQNQKSGSTGPKAGKAKAAKNPEPLEEEEQEEAEGVWDLTHRGLYLIGHATYAIPTQPGDIADDARHAAGFAELPINSHVDDSWGFGVRLGYRLIDRFALEGQFEFLNDINVEQHLQTDNSNNHSVARFLTATANAKAFLLTGRIQPYALAGAGYGYSDIDPTGDNHHDRSDGFVSRFGLGADLYANESVGVMSEVSYVLPTGGVSSFDNLAIEFGILLHF
jgi:opacity protein-like surface antigen